MSLGTSILIDELEADRIPYELLPHPRTFTAADEAEALGLEPCQVAKTVVLETSSEYVRAVLPASKRLDLEKVRRALETDAVRVASERALVGAFPEFELGAVPPLAGPPDKVIVDAGLATADWIVLEAGAHDMSVRLKTAALLTASRARVADICA
jgi:Ala-tRNA(Pro) deacylase